MNNAPHLSYISNATPFPQDFVSGPILEDTSLLLTCRRMCLKFPMKEAQAPLRIILTERGRVKNCDQDQTDTV